jgi:hypothetical protein
MYGLALFLPAMMDALPATNLANCFPPPKTASISTVARSVLDGADFVGFVRVLDDGDEATGKPQRLERLLAFKGDGDEIAMETGREADGSVRVDSSKFLTLPVQSGSIAFTALRLSTRGASVPACTALAIRSRSLPELIKALQDISKG